MTAAESTASRPRVAPAAVAAGLVVVFVAITAWWLGADTRVPDFDNGKHLNIAFLFHDQWDAGRLRAPFDEFTSYPPFVHLVGALGAFVGGVNLSAPVLAQNVVFLPLLALGCYLTGRIASGRDLGGLLAVAFALGTPIVVSQFHVFMLDGPQAALVAATVGLLLASRRFASLPLSGLAGLTAGLAMLSKQTTPLFLAGLVAVILARGGWRHWRGLAAFLVVGAVIAAPWYIAHADDLRGLTQGATTLAPSGGGSAPANPDSPTPPRWSTQNGFWYLWAFLNHQYLLPLALFVAAGTVLAVVGFVRRGRPDDDPTPELVVGGLSAYLAMTFLVTFHDVRYTLSMLVYVAVLGTAWIARSPRRVRVPAAAALGLVAAANLAIVSFGIDRPRRIDLPNAPQSGLHVRQLTLWSPEGYIVGGPEKGGDVPAIMRAAKAQGVRQIGFEPIALPFFNASGLTAIARTVDFPLGIQMDPARLNPSGGFVFLRPIGGIYSRPCRRLSAQEGIFFARAQGQKDFKRWRLSCPIRGGA
ncbi:MAG: Dolichyl-phosphate-mannose-protein mannosyltransferase [Solirubrobacteraceae bacterium]|nr:Dolichyl-phosphate-mannose-protein mannosyltransferase [Solirubrobacteraceae bacterium]